MVIIVAVIGSTFYAWMMAPERIGGYNKADVVNIMHGNWLRFLRRVWEG